MSSFPNNPNMDNLLLQSLMGRLQLRTPINNPLVSQSLEDFLFDAANNLDLHEDDDDNDNDEGKSELAKEEAKLEREIVKIILSGKSDSLKPNSGQAVSVLDHHICVGFQEEEGSDYRVWEWHGHVMVFDEENGYSPEYIYGNYFQRLMPKKPSGGGGGGSGVEKEEKLENLGLRELIDTKDSTEARIIHRNINAGSPSQARQRRVSTEAWDELLFPEDIGAAVFYVYLYQLKKLLVAWCCRAYALCSYRCFRFCLLDVKLEIVFINMGDGATVAVPSHCFEIDAIKSPSIANFAISIMPYHSVVFNVDLADLITICIFQINVRAKFEEP
ncbi:hypothetical protein RJT34_18964 [Clitoria ternatea]|uniref:Uncharacterized protein n=1 Tax=Clitoria ternatea TaxID=43366 RepID=A0AAN9P2Z7_CLITE